MSINRKWAFARTDHFDDHGGVWIAEARSGTGTWVIRELAGDDVFPPKPGRSAPSARLGRLRRWVARVFGFAVTDPAQPFDVPHDVRGYPTLIVGAMFDFPDESRIETLLFMTPEQRAALGMDDETYQALNIGLALDDARRSREGLP